MTGQMTLPLAPSPANSSAARAVRPKRRPYRDRLTLPVLLLLTIVAGLLRFVALDRPSVWGDEAATYGRVAGTYQELLNQLVDSSFPPLHYQLEWWVAQGMPYWGTIEAPADDGGPRAFMPTKFFVPGGIPLTPFVLRFIPALGGTLFVPAIYFLAVQLFGRRVALTAACLACFSAYNLVYSRDAKMYMHFWLCVTLHVACVLWWVRTRRPLAWAFWMLSGVSMVGLHGSGFFVLAIDAMIVFTTPRQHWGKLFPMAGLTLWPLAAGPLYAFEKIRQRRGWRERWRWRRFTLWPKLIRRNFQWPLVVGFAIGLSMMLAAALGPLGYYASFSQKMQKAAEDVRSETNLNELGIGWVGPYNRGRQLPDFLLYTASAYLTGWEWPRHFPEQKISDHDFIEPNTQSRSFIHPRTLRLLQGATIVLLALLAVGLVPWRRAFSPIRARLDRVRQDGRVWPPLRSRRVLWVAVWLTAVPWVTYTQSVARPANVLDAVAGLTLTTPPTVDWPRAKSHPQLAPLAPAPDGVAAPADPSGWAATIVAWTRDTWGGTSIGVRRATAAVKRAAGDVAGAWPTAWKTYTEAFRRDNVSVWKTGLLAGVGLAAMGMLISARRRLMRGALRLAVVGVVLVVVGSVVNLLPRRIDDIVWMPRYLGTILPAVWVFVAVLIDRQPRALRWATLALFVVVNLSQFSARVWGHTEPPTALMAADVVAAQPKSVIATQPEKPAFRAYLEFGRFNMAEPGGGTLFTSAGRYYLHVLSGVKPDDLRQIRYGGYESKLRMTRFVAPRAIDRDLKGQSQVERFVVWTALPAGEIDQTDAIADQLSGRYRRVSEELWPVRDHWRWVERWQVRRRTYIRIGPPATRPFSSTRPG